MEYKFRGYDAVGNKKWVYGDLVHNKRVDLTDRVMVGGYEVVPESVGLWTGLKDNNGKEVYEGDIVSNSWCFGKYSIIKFGEYKHLNAQSEYVNGDFGFYLYHIDDFQRNVERNDILFYFGNTEKSEIVGNVFENKELLNNKMKDLNILHLPLKAKWYEMQERGEKTEEYREITPYWVKRLVWDEDNDKSVSECDIKFICSQPKGIENLFDAGWKPRPYTHVLFRYGYTQRTFTSRIDSITIGRGKPEWGAPTDRFVFIIKHHREEV